MRGRYLSPLANEPFDSLTLVPGPRYWTKEFQTMTMKSPDRGVRTGASILAVTLQILSGISIAATLFATYAVSRLGT